MKAALAWRFNNQELINEPENLKCDSHWRKKIYKIATFTL